MKVINKVIILSYIYLLLLKSDPNFSAYNLVSVGKNEIFCLVTPYLDAYINIKFH